MRRILIIVCSLLFFSIPTIQVVAQDEEPATSAYAGTRECRSCHRSIQRDFRDTPHANALADGTEKLIADLEQNPPSMVFPGEDEARPITEDDINFSMGLGGDFQRYVYSEEGTGSFYVLPYQWNTVTSEWEAFSLSDEDWPNEAYDFTQNCAGCHTTGLNVETGEWVEPGIGCEACHGPAAEHAAIADELPRDASNEEWATLYDAIYVAPNAEVCGQCHVRGTSPDGIHPFPTGTEFPNTVEFDLYDVDDAAHFWESGHAKQPNQQFTEWMHSGHAGALETLQSSEMAAPECLRCHSADYNYTQSLIALVEAGDREGEAPEPLTPETAQFGVTCQSCHNPHLTNEGLLIDEPLALCGSCHGDDGGIYEGIHHPTTEFFEGQMVIADVEGVPSTHYKEENGPNCITCHMMTMPMEDYTRVSHALDIIQPLDAAEGQLDSCTECHTTLTPTDLNLLMTDIQDSVRERLTVGLARVASVPEPEEGSMTYEQYHQIVDALTFVQNEGSLGLHNYAYTDALLDFAEHELSELSVGGQADFSPTEAPAPTATFSPQEMEEIFATRDEEVLESGIRPISQVIVGSVFVFLAISAFLFFRKPSKSVSIIILVMIFSGLTAQSTLAQDEEVDDELYPSNDYCLLCHEDTDNTWELPSGEELSVNIDSEVLAQSVHGDSNPEGALNCVDCHIDQRFPHQTPMAQTAREFALERYATCRTCHEDQYTHAQDSVHGAAVRRGEIQAAVCVDCHGGHDIQPPDEPRQRVSLTCGKCHGVILDEYQNSVHGAALIDEDNFDVPTCISCHTAHDIETTTNTLFRNRSPELCATCHADSELMEKYGISTHVFDSYLTDFHGTTVALFEQQDENVPTNKAVCYDCHGVHNIQSVSAEGSQVVRENLLTTCQKCHPDATENFPDSWVGHYPPTTESNALLYYVNLFYEILIPAVVGAFIFLIATDIIRRLRGGTSEATHHEEGK